MLEFYLYCFSAVASGLEVSKEVGTPLVGAGDKLEIELLEARQTKKGCGLS